MDQIQMIFAGNWIASHKWAAGLLLMVYGLEQVLEFLKGAGVIKFALPAKIGALLGQLTGMVVQKTATKARSMFMKKAVWVLLIMTALCSMTPAYADIWGPSHAPKAKIQEKASEATAVPAVDPGTILAYVSAAANRLGVREGTFYDAKQKDFANYAAATLYTFPDPYNVAIDFGAINLDGVALTVDWNVGATIPSGGDPVTSAIQYLYVGGGVDERNVDKSDTDPTKTWQTGYGVDVQFKGTF